MHILHILHIFLHIFCILYMHKKPGIRVYPCLFPLLLVPPCEGPAVDVPPPTTIAAVMGFIAGSSWKVGWFSSHVKGYRPNLSQRNKWKASQYGGKWNDIQHLCLFTALVNDCGLTLIHPCCNRKKSKNAKNAKYALYVQYDLLFLAHCTPLAQKHRHSRAPPSQRLFLNVF